MRIILIVGITFLIFSCNSQDKTSPNSELLGDIIQLQEADKTTFDFDQTGRTIEKRFLVSEPMQRVPVNKSSFAYYLRTLPLKPSGSIVKLYDGTRKSDQNVAAAVIDLPIGNRDLHQCADGIMHLKARYHFERKEYQKIGFHFVNGFYCDYDRWKNGYRVRVVGNKTNWYKSTNKDSSAATFWKYLEMVFSYAGTLSLAKELKAVSLEEIQVGDIFIVGGSPGHAIVVVDMSINIKSGEKFILLAQSYMPAQELHVLNNYSYESTGPWYSLHELQNQISTPEWTFNPEHLKRFKQ